MARTYPKRRADPPTKTVGTRGFSLGLNQLTHPTMIKDNELAEAQNVLYTQNGVLSKRPGSVNIGEPRGSSTRVNTLQGVYKIGIAPNFQNYLLRISTDGIMQRYSFDSQTWIDIPSSPTFANVDSQILQAYGYVYIINENDLITKWDGTSFTTFTAVANPTSAPTLAKTGSATGSKKYYYRYVWYNNVGNTTASPSANLASLPDPLDASTYVTVTVPTAPTGVIKTAIFRGTIDGSEEFLTSFPAEQLTYQDKGFDVTDSNVGTPEDNTTTGYRFKFADVYHDTLIGVTVEHGDDMLVFSAGGDKFDSFGHADGGGYYGWRRGDGDPITGVKAFQDSLYVFKGRKVGAFKFDEGGGAVTDINLAIGAVSHRSIHAAGDDLRFWGRDGAMSLGNEPNFANIIRTKVLSARADKLVQSLTASEFSKISGAYYKNISLWGIPTGGVAEGITSTIAYDERYVAWSEWLGLTPHVWAKYIDDDNQELLFYGDSQSGNVVQCWQGTHDRGEAVVFRVATKQFDMDVPHMYKTFGTLFLIFGNVSGSGTRITLVEDGQRSQIPLALYADVGDMGFGTDEWGTMEFGDSSGEFVGDTSGLLVRYVDINADLFSLQTILTNDGLEDIIQFIGIFQTYQDSSQPLPSNKRLGRVFS